MMNKSKKAEDWKYFSLVCAWEKSGGVFESHGAGILTELGQAQAEKRHRKAKRLHGHGREWEEWEIKGQHVYKFTQG